MTDYAGRLAALTAEPSRDDCDDPNRLARVERTRAEMMLQGAAVAATIAREHAAAEEVARRLRERAIDRVVIAGCGDSWLVGLGVRHAWESLTGWPLEAAQALDYACYGAAVANARTLVIGLSAGGGTPAVMDALAAARRRGAFAIGVSNTAGSPIVTGFDAALLVHATRTGWPTQSSTAAMALLVQLAIAVAEAKELSGDAAAHRAELNAVPVMMDSLAREARRAHGRHRRAVRGGAHRVLRRPRAEPRDGRLRRCQDEGAVAHPCRRDAARGVSSLPSTEGGRSAVPGRDRSGELLRARSTRRW